MIEVCETCKHESKECYETPCLHCYVAFGEERKWEPVVRTQADRIRAMTDEELAKFLGTVIACGECPIVQSCDTFLREDCRKNLLHWLQEKVEEA